MGTSMAGASGCVNLSKDSLDEFSQFFCGEMVVPGQIAVFEDQYQSFSDLLWVPSDIKPDGTR